MSEERRKRQQAREDEASGVTRAKRIRAWAAVVLLFVAAFVGGRFYRVHNHRYDAFAKCLTAKQAKMYGLYWCPHCRDQKEMFSASFEYVNYVECAIRGSSEEAPQCKAAGVKLFPSWQFGSAPPKEGVLSLDALSAKTGCSLP